jgi:hypothetical protein
MHVTRIHADQNGESHFEDIEIDLSPMEAAPPSAPLSVSSLAAERIVFAQFPPGWFGDWHPAPKRQYWVGILGIVEATVSDGEVRVFGPGNIVLLDDLVGKGHTTRVRGEQGAQAMFVQL